MGNIWEVTVVGVVVLGSCWDSKEAVSSVDDDLKCKRMDNFNEGGCKFLETSSLKNY